MAAVGELLILIAGNNAALTASLAKSEAELRAFSGTAGTHGAVASNGLRNVGIAAGLMAVATAAAAAGSVNAAADFQDKLAIINTLAKQTPEELNKTGESIRAMAVSSGEPLNTLADAFYDLLSAGVEQGDAMSVLGNSTTLAIGGLATTAQTVDLLTTAMNAYGLNAQGVTRATDQFALAVADGKLHADDIAATFANIAPLARQSGISIGEISAAYGFLTARGVPAAEVTTQMNRAIIELLKPNADLIALQKETGVVFADVAREDGLVVALQRMREEADAAGVPFQDLFGRLEGLKFALQTTGPNFKNYQDELVGMHDATGTAAEQAAERMDTFNRQAAILGASLNDLAIEVGTGFLPKVTEFVKQISGVVQGMGDWARENPGLANQLLVVVGAVSALVAIGAFLGPILGAIGTGLAIIFHPILLIAGAILGLAAHFGLLGEGARGMADGVGEMIDGVLKTIGDMIPGVLATLRQLGQAFLDWIGPMIPPALAALGRFAGEVVAWISAQIPGWLAQLGLWAQAFVAWIGPMIPPALAELGRLAGEIAAWIGQQIPGWLEQLGAWAGAFVEWIGPMIPVALTALGEVVSRILTWVSEQIPGLVEKIKEWAGAFVEWAGPVAGQVIEKIGDFAGKVAIWVLEQVPKVVEAALPLGGAIIAGVLSFATSLPGMLGDALGDAVKNFDISKFSENVETALQAALVIAAVVGAAQVVGAAWALAFGTAAAAVKGATDLITGAVKVEQAAIASGVGKVGTFVGAAFSTAFGLAAKGIGLLGPALVAVFAPVGAALATGMAPIGAAVGGALDTAIGTGMALGIPLLVAGAVLALGVGLALLINQVFPGFAADLAANFSRGVETVKTFVTEAVNKMIAGIQSVIAEILKLIDFAGKGAEAVGKIGGDLFDKTPVGRLFGGPAPTGPPGPGHHGDDALPQYQSGGVVPGVGPQMAIVHGGETITPAGQSQSGPINVTIHSVIALDGEKVGEMIERRLFDSASVFSSGFVGSPQTT